MLHAERFRFVLFLRISIEVNRGRGRFILFLLCFEALKHFKCFFFYKLQHAPWLNMLARHLTEWRDNRES